ncbi:hypothetical protein CQS04_09330 [Chryseomicrobium excrementi]|uniref:Uncharacterized protein n=1 Tax=Chryseomicrobium excrementi TaxID=2041346 RepID=A0A2M9EY21_9BACL|nr:hypothetical protein [Chryseomicrobium excrementi]PJK16109.1 hypothetical protein CQS04_09330 [Chryseomicrobium excrementi]
MESEETRLEMSSKKSIWEKYLFPITIVSSIVVSGVVGYSASQWGERSFASDSGEVEEMKEEMTKARNQSLEVIEAEIPEILSDLETYSEDIKLVSENITIVENSLQPIRDVSEKVNTAISIARNVNVVTRIGYIDRFSNKLEVAQVKLAEIDLVLLNMENLTVIQKDMQESHAKISNLYGEYQKEKNIDYLLDIDKELNSNLVYRMEELKNLTNEAHELLEFSSDIVETTNSVADFLNNPTETSKELFEAVQFWKDENEKAEAEEVDKEIEEDIKTSKEKIQDLPTKLEEQSRNTITSIHTIQKELQTVKITEMVIGE